MQPSNVTGRARRIILTLVMLALAGFVVWWVLTRPTAPRYLCDDVRAAGRPGCTHPGTTTP